HRRLERRDDRPVVLVAVGVAPGVRIPPRVGHGGPRHATVGYGDPRHAPVRHGGPPPAAAPLGVGVGDEADGGGRGGEGRDANPTGWVAHGSSCAAGPVAPGGRVAGAFLVRKGVLV